MAKPKAVEAKRELFALKHPEEAKKALLKDKRSILFREFVPPMVGLIRVYPPDADGMLLIKGQIRRADSVRCKTLEDWADGDDFEDIFRRVAKEVARKMAEMAPKRRGSSKIR